MPILEWVPNVVSAFLLTVILIRLLDGPARYFGLLDEPGYRKHHDRAVPLIGGLAMCAAFIASAFFTHISLQQYYGLFLAMALLAAVGVSDDLFDLSAVTRFVAQAIGVMLIFFLGDVHLSELGDLIGLGNLQLHGWSFPLTVFCVVGVINAVNMIDGLDGLAGGVSFIAIFWLIILTVPLADGYGPDSAVLLLLLGVIAGFLFFNLRHPWRLQASVFMGDAGSMVLGLALAWFMVDLSQGEQPAFAPIVAVWILGLPLLDTVSIMIRRALNGTSPFQADREHMHHILLMYGYSDGEAVCILLIISALLGAVGVAGWYLAVPEPILFYAFMSLFTLYFFGSRHALRGAKKGAKTQQIPRTEQG